MPMLMPSLGAWTRERGRGVRDQARYNSPGKPYTCLPGLYIVYDLDDAICRLNCTRIFLQLECK